MDINNEYCHRASFEKKSIGTSPLNFPLIDNYNFHKEMSDAVWRHHMIVTEIDKMITKTEMVKRITLTEPNTEGHLKECLSQYEKENLKTK